MPPEQGRVPGLWPVEGKELGNLILGVPPETGKVIEAVTPGHVAQLQRMGGLIIDEDSQKALTDAAPELLSLAASNLVGKVEALRNHDDLDELFELPLPVAPYVLVPATVNKETRFFWCRNIESERHFCHQCGSEVRLIPDSKKDDRWWIGPGACLMVFTAVALNLPKNCFGRIVTDPAWAFWGLSSTTLPEVASHYRGVLRLQIVNNSRLRLPVDLDEWKNRWNLETLHVSLWLQRKSADYSADRRTRGGQRDGVVADDGLPSVGQARFPSQTATDAAPWHVFLGLEISALGGLGLGLTLLTLQPSDGLNNAGWGAFLVGGVSLLGLIALAIVNCFRQ